MALVARASISLLMLLACTLALAGCAPPEKPAEAVLSLHIAAVPSMRPAADGLAAAYEAEEEHVAVEVSEGRSDEVLLAVATGRADLGLVEEAPRATSLLDPDTGRPWLRTWPLGLDQVAVIVNPANPVQSLTLPQLSRAYEGLERRWDALGGADEPIRLVSREPGAPARVTFEAGILREDHIAGTAVIMPGDEAVVDYVATHTDAIGYISSTWAGDDVKVIALNGALPDTTGNGYPLTHPVYLVTSTGPSGKVRAFLRFFRNGPGHDTVARFYAVS